MFLRVSSAMDGRSGDGSSYRPAISADGRFIVFASSAADLVEADTNQTWDIFLYDRETGVTGLISKAPDGSSANGPSGYWSNPSISADGRWIAFASQAANLVPGDANQAADVFVHDRQTGQNRLISGVFGQQWMSAAGWSDWPVISPDGRYVTFTSTAPNAAPGDTNAARDIFLHDLHTHRTRLASLAADGSQPASNSGWASSVSQGGRYVAFASSDPLVPEDTNQAWDVYLRDLMANSTLRLSVSSSGEQGDGDSGFWSSLGMSADGSLVAYQSRAANLVNNDRNGKVDIFVRDWQKNLTRRSSVDSQGHEVSADCAWPSLSPDGRFVAFTCQADPLAAGDTNHTWDVYARDRLYHHTWRVSVTPQGTQGSMPSGYWIGSSISANGEWVVFPSLSANLAGKDQNRLWDIFAVRFAYLRGQAVVQAGLQGLGMPYCSPAEERYRGCPVEGPCGGPFYGFPCGVCTDLVLDAYETGGGMELHDALVEDRLAHPDHLYTWGDARNAGDLWRYFSYTGQLKSMDQDFLPGDVVFFDWQGDGAVDHAALVSQVRAGDAPGKPMRPSHLIHLIGKGDSNPDGLAHEIRWTAYHQQTYAGHAR
jgi:Tol biopolymer transport system component